MNAHKTILDLCGGTGSWSKYYAENGYNVVVATYPDWDVTDPYDQDELIAIKPYGILAAPPCTMFSIARHVSQILGYGKSDGIFEIISRESCACFSTI